MDEVREFGEAAGVTFLADDLEKGAYRSLVGDVETMQYFTTDGRSIVTLRRQKGEPALVVLAEG